MPISAFSVDELLNELNRRNPWLNRRQTAPLVGDVQPSTLATKDSRKSWTLRGYKFDENGRVKYRWLDIQNYIRQQQMPE